MPGISRVYVVKNHMNKHRKEELSEIKEERKGNKKSEKGKKKGDCPCGKGK